MRRSMVIACVLLSCGIWTAWSLSAEDAPPQIDQKLLIHCALTNYIETPFVENVVAAVTKKEFSSGGVSIPAGAEVSGIAIPGDRIIAARDEWVLRWRDKKANGPENILKVKAKAITNIVAKKFPPTSPKAGIGGFAVEPGPVDDILVFFGFVDDYRGAPKRIKAPVGTAFVLQLESPFDKTAVVVNGK